MRIVIAVAALFVAAACGVTVPETCAPGQSIQCSGPGGCVGYQVCRDDGSRYGACICAPDASDPDASTPDANIDGAAVYGGACGAPDGVAKMLDSTQVPAAVAGRWWCCGGAAELTPTGTGAVELTLDGHWYQLTQVDGSWVRNLGPSSSGTFTVEASQPSIHFALDFAYTSGDAFGYPLNGMILDNPDPKATLGGGTYVAIQ